MHLNISEHEALFSSYATSFCQKAEKKDMLELKIVHSQRVFEHMQNLVREESVLFSQARACLLAALYHDIGRFLQFSTYGTFKDTLSVNHASLGAKILNEQGFLKHETRTVQRQVLTAVSMHNRYMLPKKLASTLTAITNAVRDADKLDILRIMAEHFTNRDPKKSAVTFNAKDAPMLYSEKILQDVMHNRLASYGDIVFINDFKLLLCSWIHDMHYQSTKRALLASAYIEKILADLPNIPVMRTVQNHVLKNLKNVI